MDNSITNDNNDDVEILIRNWKKIPVIGTQVLMNNFPYAIAPWEHWNLLIDELKKNNNKSSLEKPEESTPKEPVDNFEETGKNNEPSEPISIPKSIPNFVDFADNGLVDWESDNES